MPTRPLGPCAIRTCPNLAVAKGRCPLHPPPTRTHDLSASRRGYGVDWRRIAAAVLERDGSVCRYCGGLATTVDHLLPKARGGSDDEANLVAACLRCNSRKGAR